MQQRIINLIKKMKQIVPTLKRCDEQQNIHCKIKVGNIYMLITQMNECTKSIHCSSTCNHIWPYLLFIMVSYGHSICYRYSLLISPINGPDHEENEQHLSNKYKSDFSYSPCYHLTNDYSNALHIWSSLSVK